MAEPLSAKHDPLCNSYIHPGFHCDCGLNKTDAEDAWTKIALHCPECGAQFFRKVKGQKYCDKHRHLSGAVIRPQEPQSSKLIVEMSLVERLRALAKVLYPQPGGETNHATCDSAADEIERLERERDRWEQGYRHNAALATEMIERRDRLRVALEKYGEHLRSCRTKDWTAGKHSWDDAACDCGLREALKNP